MSEKTLSEQSYALCIEIEALPASEKQTQVSVMASELRVACESAEARYAAVMEWARGKCECCAYDDDVEVCLICREDSNWTPAWPEGVKP